MKKNMAISGDAGKISAVCLNAKNSLDVAYGDIAVFAAKGCENRVADAKGDVLSLALLDASSIVGNADGNISSGAIIEARIKSGECKGGTIAVSAVLSSAEAGAAGCAATLSGFGSLCEIRELRSFSFSFGGLLSATNIGKTGSFAKVFTISALAAWNMVDESMRGLVVSIGAWASNDIKRMAGVAITTGFNVFEEFSGLCIGPVNICRKEFRGVQIGILNIDKSAKRFRCLPLIRVKRGNRESIKTDALQH